MTQAAAALIVTGIVLIIAAARITLIAIRYRREKS